MLRVGTYSLVVISTFLQVVRLLTVYHWKYNIDIIYNQQVYRQTILNSAIQIVTVILNTHRKWLKHLKKLMIPCLWYSDRFHTPEVTNQGSNDEPTMHLLQRKFLNYIKVCDVSSVRGLFENRRHFDLNRKNYQRYDWFEFGHRSQYYNCERMMDLQLSKSGLDIGNYLIYDYSQNRYSIAVKQLAIL